LRQKATHPLSLSFFVFFLAEQISLEMKVKPHPLSSRQCFLSVTNLEGQTESMLVNLHGNGAQLLSAIALKYRYPNTDELRLHIHGTDKQGFPFSFPFLFFSFFGSDETKKKNKKSASTGTSPTARSQPRLTGECCMHVLDICDSLTVQVQIVVSRLSDNEIKKQRYSIANIKKKAQEANQVVVGATLICIQNYTAQSPSELPMKKGDHIVVLEENESGWWKGQIGKEGKKKKKTITTPAATRIEISLFLFKKKLGCFL
jgi:hypothetical protein